MLLFPETLRPGNRNMHTLQGPEQVAFPEKKNLYKKFSQYLKEDEAEGLA